MGRAGSGGAEEKGDVPGMVGGRSGGTAPGCTSILGERIVGGPGQPEGASGGSTTGPGMTTPAGAGPQTWQAPSQRPLIAARPLLAHLRVAWSGSQFAANRKA